MPIRVECDQCAKAYNVPDERLGQQFKCRNCGNRLTVGSNDEDPYGSSYEPTMPARSGSGRRSARPATKSSGSSFPIVPVLIGVVAFAVVGVGVYFAVKSLGDGQTAETAAGSSAVSGSASPAFQPTTVPTAMPEAMAQTPGTGMPSGMEISPPIPPGSTTIPQSTPTALNSVPSLSGSGDRNEKIAWAVVPDPPRANIAWPEKLKLDIPFQGDCEGLLYPETPGTFMLAGWDHGNSENMIIVDLLTGKESSRFTVKLGPSLKHAFSPDGQFLAVQKLDPRGSVAIWSPGNPQPVNSIMVLRTAEDHVNYMAFRSPTELVVAGLTGNKDRMQKRIAVFNITSGQIISDLITDKSLNFEKITLSPGGRFAFNLDYTAGFTVFDLDTGKCVADEPLRKNSDNGNSLTNESIRMTDDGREICILRSSPWETILSFHDAATGKEMSSITLAGHIHRLADNDMLHKGRRIQFMRNNEFILLGGQLLVHRKSKRIVWSMSVLPSQDQYSLQNSAERRVAGNQLIMATGPRNAPKLESMPIDFGPIESALTNVESGGTAMISPNDGKMAINLEIDSIRFGDIAQTKATLTETLTDRLSAEGLTVSADAPAVLTLKYAEGAGELMSQQAFRPGVPRSQQPPQQQGEATLESTRAMIQLSLRIDNKEVWNKTIELNPSVLFVKGNATAETARASVFEEVQKALYGIPMVWYVSADKPTVTLPVIKTLQSEGIVIGGRRPTRRPGSR